MSSEKTPNLQLHKWQATDYVQRTEFNDNFEKIDDAHKQVTEQLAQNEQSFYDDSFWSNEVSFMATWHGYLEGDNFEFYVSNDAKTYLPINKKPVFPSIGMMRDYHLFEHNGTFNVLYDSDNSVHITTTTDFKTWTDRKLTVTGLVRQWATKFFVDTNGDKYLLITGNTVIESDVDKNGTTIPKLKLYYAKFTDDTLTTLETPKLFTMPDTTNRIDHMIAFENGLYHMFVKNEYAKTIEHFTSSTFNGAYTFVETISFQFDVEAPAIIKFNGLYYLYADVYVGGFTLCKTSSDLQTWSTEFRVGAKNGATTRHFQPMVTNDSIVKGKIKEFALSQNKVNVQELTSTTIQNEIRRDNKTVTIARTNATIDNLKVFSGFTYSVQSSAVVTINTLDLTALKEGDFIYLMLASESGVAKITVKNGVTFKLPNGEDFVISKENRNNVTRIKFHFDGSKLLIDNSSGNFNTFYNSKESEYYRIDLSTLAVDGVVSNLVLQNNTVYYITSGNITVNSVDVTNIPQLRGRVYFCLLSGSTVPSLTLKNGSGLSLPGNVDYVISKNNRNNESVLPFMNAWSALRMISG